MMHEREKSDPAVVAVKPANKWWRSAAESVEPRAGTEWNADQHSTRQTQGWASVSQALDRIRQAARQRKEDKFTALFSHPSFDLLEEGFLQPEKNAAARGDGLTWKDYEADLGHN